MPKLSALLCLLAIIAAQVPMLACASDCQAIMVSAAAGHDCHVAGHHHKGHAKAQIELQDEDFHYHGCVGHSHRSRSRHGPAHSEQSDKQPCGEEEGEDEHPIADHQLIHAPVIVDGAFVELPEHLRLHTLLVFDLGASAHPSAHAALEAAHQAEPDPIPFPLPASTRLLL